LVGCFETTEEKELRTMAIIRRIMRILTILILLPPLICETGVMVGHYYCVTTELSTACCGCEVVDQDGSMGKWDRNEERNADEGFKNIPQGSFLRND
jgi:hypothetical protein